METVDIEKLESNLNQIRERITQACERSGRSVDDVELVAVSKGHPLERIRAFTELGLTVFGENKVQEARKKMPDSPRQAVWHMIGHLQTNKCKDVVNGFALIHSVDSLKLVEELQKHLDKFAKVQPVLLQVNIAGEASKHGFSPAELEMVWDQLLELDRLEIHGFMTMAPWTPEPEKTRPVFRKLKELQGVYENRLGAPLPTLSMGMSGDFEVAIEEGATLIRVGSALFGSRK